MKKRAVFLDRDGTLNEDVGYPSVFSQIHIFPAAFEAVRKIRSAGFLTVVVTNQSAVGRGLLTEDGLKNIHKNISASFAAEGAELDAFYYCPHYERAALPIYRKNCDCRKPGPGLAVRAAADLDLDLSASYVIGDKTEDIEFALNTGATPVLVLTGCGRESQLKLEEKGLRPAFVAEDILAAANWILRRERNVEETGAG
jgi:D-glycero-D-manno-heptose 1,7-bisphosphate phosphatase